jgi:phage-related baseplate assembly protein
VAASKETLLPAPPTCRFVEIAGPESTYSGHALRDQGTVSDSATGAGSCVAVVIRLLAMRLLTIPHASVLMITPRDEDVLALEPTLMM